MSSISKLSGREDKESPSMETQTQYLTPPPRKRGAAVQNRKSVSGNGEDIGRTVFRSISTDVEKVNRHRKRNFGSRLDQNAQTPAMKKQDKTDPNQIEIIDRDPEFDSGPMPISSSDPRIKKRKISSLTYVLSARSKVACGNCERPNSEIDEIEKSKTPNSQIDEIDLPDVNNQFSVVEYVEDLYNFYKRQQHVARPIDYMDKQPEIKIKMRAVLIDWIVQVHQEYNMMPETLYLTTYIIDRYLSLEIVPRRQFQLVGVCAMIIACKYEEIWAPLISDFIDISDNAYSREEILGKEKEILNKLDWYMTVPTAYMFLVRFVKAAKADKESEHMIYFFAELGLMQYDMIRYCPSMVAASAVYAARCTLNKSPLWTDTLQRHTSFSEHQLLECAQVLVNAHAAAPNSRLKVVYKKYMLEQFGRVACYSPAGNLIERLKSAVPSSS